MHMNPHYVAISTEESRQIIQSLKPEDRAWAAGFFDGEGCFFAAGRRKNKLGVIIVQVDPEVLVKFCRIMGLGRVNGPKLSPSRQAKGWKPIYEFRVTGAQATHVARVMWPYLGSQKKNRYREITSD